MKLIRVKSVKRLARELSGKRLVSRKFTDAINEEVREAIERRLNHHDNKCGGRKTLA